MKGSETSSGRGGESAEALAGPWGWARTNPAISVDHGAEDDGKKELAEPFDDSNHSIGYREDSGLVSQHGTVG